MPIKDILNKVANKEAIEDQEYNELGAWVQQYPTAAPIVNKMMQGGAEAMSPDELSLVQMHLDASKRVEAREAPRRELEAAATRGTTLGSKIKDLAASFGEASAAVPGMAQKSVGFLADLTARGMAAKALRPNAVPADFRQKVEEGVGKVGTKSMEKVIELLERGRGVEKSEAKATAARMASDFADDESLKKVYQEMKSPELLARQQLSQERATKAFESRGGGLAGAAAELGSQVKDLVTDPALLANMAASQLPIAGVAMATGALGTAAAVGSGAVMQGADIGGQVYDDLMALPDEAWEGNEAFASRVAAGEDPTAVKQDIANAKARQAFAVSGAASAALNATPWGSLSERALAMTGARRAASTNVIKAIGSGVLKTGAEGVTEAAEEGIGAVAGNIAKSPITGEDIFKDVGTATAQGFLGSVAGPSIVAGQVEAMAERRQAMAQGAPPSSGQMISKPVAPTAAPTAATQAAQPAAPQAAPVAPTAAPEVQNAPPVAADEAEARGQSSILSSQLEAKREDIAMQFEDLLAANPDDANMAAEAQAWRQKNPLKDAEDFEAYYEQVRLGTIESMAMQDPRTQEAEQQAQVVQEKTEQVMALVESNDTTSAPPPGVTLAQMQAAHADGGKAMQEEAKAAQENARTVKQTIAKEIDQETPKPEIAKTVQKRQKEGAQELSTYIEAVNAGAVSMDPAKFQALGVKAGMSEEAVAMKMATVQKKQNDKAAEAAEEQGFTPASRGEESQNLSGLNAPPTAAPGALLEQGAKEIEQDMASSEPGAPLAESPSFGSRNRIFTEQSRGEALARLRAKMQAQRSTLNSMPGMDPELMRDGMLVVGFYLEAGVRKFVEVSARVAEDLGATVRELRPYLRSWYNGARDMMEDNGVDVRGMDTADQVAIELKSMIDAIPVNTPANGKATPLVEAIMATGRLPEDNNQLKAMLAEIDGKTPDVLRMKEGQEAVEVVVALTARATIKASREAGASRLGTFIPLRDLYLSQPRLNIRTSTSLENQAYSTPAPLAYLAGELAGLGSGSVYEPTAGNGMLLIGAETGRAWVNELDPQRFERLHAFGFAHVRNGDALGAMDSGFILPRSVDSVIANPPFGTYKVDGKSATAEFDGYHLGKIDHIIAAEALQAMKDNGRASLIIGGIKFGEEPSKADKIFMNWLHRRYNVVDVFQVDGKLYERQGAAWPVRVLTIDGRGKSTRKPNDPVPELKTWEEVYAHAAAILDAKANGERISDASRDVPQQQEDRPAGDSVPRGGRAGSVDRGEQGTRPVPGDVREGTPGPGLESIDREPSLADGAGPSPVAEPELPGDGSDATSGGTTAADGEPVAPDGARSSVDDAIDLEALTQPYTAKPYLTELDQGVFVPTNLKQGMETGEAWLRENVGDVETFLQQELGYKPEELRSALMGLQAESVAGTIANMKNPKATIIADDTGIGKGRQAYMMIRWAIKNGKIPVFLTADPMLFSDMYQEAIDCGDNGLLKPYLVNDGANIEILNGDVVERPFRSSTTRSQDLQKIAATGQLPPSANAMFLTYSQLQVANIQRKALMAIAPNGILIMDEAHLASGEESARGTFFRNLMPEFYGAGYFSATWAKRAGNMSLYTKSAIGDLGMSTEELSNAVERGGLPLQSIIASSMAKNSQFYRRERSFEGVDYRTVIYGQTREDGTRELSGAMPPEEHVRLHDAVTSCFRSIIEADNAFTGWFEDELKPQLMAQGVLEAGKSTTDQLVTRAPFTSIVHNGVKILSLALKADWVADTAIEALKRGEAPVIVLENTMGSFLADYVSTHQIKVGDPINNFGWSDVLKRYLDRTRYYNAKAETGESMSGELGPMNEEGEFQLTEPVAKKGGKKSANRVTVPMDWLPADVKASYLAAERQIEALDIMAPASPIDWVRHRLNKAGYSVEEISGVSRAMRVNYSDKIPTLQMETGGKRERKKSLRDFNRRKVDALILTNAGSVGISAHCDKRWSDPKNPNRRHMIVWQAAQDINVFKQILGRVHRTGQLVPPRYSIMALDLPSERRPIARLQKKFKSLNASTSSNTKGNMDVEGVDLLNRYGDEVVGGFLAERPDMAAWLGIHLGDSEAMEMLINLAEKATGRLAILPVKSQLEFYDAVIPAYTAKIDFLTRTGQNKLLKRKLDFRAEEVQRKVIYPGTGVPGPFSDPAWIVDFKCRQTAMNLKPEDVQAEIDGNLRGMAPSEHRSEILKAAAEEWQAFQEAVVSTEAMTNAAEAKRKTAQGLPEIGSQWTVELMGDKVTGVVTRLRRTGEGKLGNPYAPSKWYVRMATNGSFGHFEMPLTGFLKDASPVMGLGLAEVFAEDASPMVTRKIVMGNIFGAYTQLDKDGEIVEFTTADGKLQTGMLLPKSFDMASDLKADVKIQGGAMITGIMEKMRGTVDPFMVPEDGGALISIREGMATIELDSSARANVLKWMGLTGLEFANGSASVKVGDATTKAFERVPVRVGREVLQDIGVLKEGVVDPKAIMDPNEVMDISPEFMDVVCESLRKEGFPVDSWAMRKMVEDLKKAGATMAADQMRLESIAEQIRNGRPVEWSRMKAFVRNMFGRNLRAPDNKKSAAEKARASARDILAKSKIVAGVIARANGVEKIRGKRARTGLQSYQVESKFGDKIRKIYPFIPAEYQGTAEVMAYTEYTVFCYNTKNPETPITDLSMYDQQVKFNEYLDGGVKAMAHPMASFAALGVGMLSLGMAYNAGMNVAPEFMAMLLGGVTFAAALKVVKLAAGAIHRHATPVGRILGAMANGTNQRIVDMLNHIYLLAQPLKAKGDIELEKVKSIVTRRAVEAVSPGASSIRERIEGSVWTSKEVQAKMDQYARDIADFLEGKRELPDEIKGAEASILKHREFWANEASKYGMSLLDNYFPRMYDFDGLQALKGDSQALGRLVKELAAQVIENDEARVIEAMQENHLGSMQEAAEAVTMAILQGMYDGSEDAKRGVAKARNAALAGFVEKMLVDTGREAQRGAVYAIMNRMRKQVGPYTAGSMKRRTIPFQLPETWLGSDGAMLHLVDRDYFRVMDRYNANMSRAVAQRAGLMKGQLNRFLNSISNPKQREEVELAIRNELWNRYHVDSDMLNPDDKDGKIVAWTKEHARKAMSWHLNYNSFSKLGLSPLFWARNMLFGIPKAMAFLDLPAVFKGGQSGRYAIPGLRGSEKWYKDQYERVRVSGAIMEGVLESSIGNDKKTWRALMVGGRRSQQVVDVMGFYAGIAQMRDVVDAAKKGDSQAISDLRTALGESVAMAIMDRATGEITKDEEDLFGLHYRMLLSGSGRGFNLPSFMSHEIFQWIMQFKRIPMEDTFLWATRVRGPKAEAKYWGGAMVAGMAAMGMKAGLTALAMALLGDDDDEKEEKAVSFFEQWGLGTVKSSGALQLTEPFVAMPLIAAGYLSNDPSATTERMANQLAGGSMTLAQVARAPFTINAIRKQVEQAEGPLEVPGAMTRGIIGAFLSGYPIVNQMGLREEVQALEKGE